MIILLILVIIFVFWIWLITSAAKPVAKDYAEGNLQLDGFCKAVIVIGVIIGIISFIYLMWFL